MSLELDNYYVNQPDYWKLKHIRDLFAKGTTSKYLINYCVEYKINVNSYIKAEDGIYLPLLYFCCCSKPPHDSKESHYVPYYKWLIK